MGKILKNWRIPIAVLFSLVLIVGAYVLARGVENPPVAQASTETALLKAIATKDSNGDGLPDWEKVLYGIPIDSTTTDYFHLGMTDGEAVARGLIVPKAIADIPAAPSTSTSTEGTLTDTFAKNFFSLYLAAKQVNGGAELSSDQTNALADQVMNQLASSVSAAPDFKSASDITVSGSGADAMKAFAASAEAVFKNNTSNATTSEIEYLQYALLGGDDSALAHIASIAEADRNSAVGLATLPIPEELATADLELVNALMRIGEINSDFARVNVDPLAAMLALQQYSQAEQSLGKAFSDIGDTYTLNGVVLPSGTPGASFVNLIANLTAQQQAASGGINP